MQDDNSSNDGSDGGKPAKGVSEKAQMAFGITAMACFTAVVITVLVLIFN